MADTLQITVNKPGIPSGYVLLSDVAAVGEGIFDSLAKLVQRDMGYHERRKLLKEAKDLTSIALMGVNRGSGVLACEILPVPGLSGRAPASIAADNLVRAIEMYQSSGEWPRFFPSVIRNRIGQALSPLVTEDSSISLSFSGEYSHHECSVGEEIHSALRVPEQYSTEERVNLVGTMFDLNRGESLFKIRTENSRYTVHYPSDWRERIDDLRWSKLFVVGYPKDRWCKNIERLLEARLALDGEEDGLSRPEEFDFIARSAVYGTLMKRLEDISALPANWNGFDAQIPERSTMEWSLGFLRSTIQVLADYEIALPQPSVIPTSTGSVQFEWTVDGRELELEVIHPNDFNFLSVDDGNEKEGHASRWLALRLIRWVTSGETV
jgi:hypothetical protein